jgi:hypothetical protein
MAVMTMPLSFLHAKINDLILINLEESILGNKAKINFHSV